MKRLTRNSGGKYAYLAVASNNSVIASAISIKNLAERLGLQVIEIEKRIFKNYVKEGPRDFHVERIRRMI